MKPRLLQQLKSVCTDKIVNTTASGDVIGPAVYLLKVLVRQHGFHCLNKVFKQFKWIVPNGIHETDEQVYRDENKAFTLNGQYVRSKVFFPDTIQF